MADEPPLLERRKRVREAALVDEIAALRSELARVLADNARLKSENQSLRADVAFWARHGRMQLERSEYRGADPLGQLTSAPGASASETAAEAGSPLPKGPRP